MGRAAILLQIIRRGHGQQADRSQFARHITRVEPRSDADRQVDAFFDQIDEAIGKVQRQVDLGISLLECRQQRGYPFEPETQRQVQAQVAAWRQARFHRIGFGTFYQIDDDSAFFQICRAGAGQGQLARGAHHQLHAQVLFQCSNLARNHRTCHSKLIGYGGKTAEIRYPHKQVHCIKTIHCCKYGNDDLLIVIYFGTDDASKVQSWPTCGLKPGNFPPALTKPHGR